jgi:putative ABC transport system substrate-binding protein
VRHCLAVLWEPASLRGWQAVEATARKRGWRLLSIRVKDAAEFEGAFGTAADARAGALLVVSGGLLTGQASRVAELALRNRLPDIYPLPLHVEAGGLASYGTDINDIWRRAALFVDKILKGAEPGDLPVERPTKFELLINLKRAKALGLMIPHEILLRADEAVPP